MGSWKDILTLDSERKQAEPMRAPAGWQERAWILAVDLMSDEFRRSRDHMAYQFDFHVSENGMNSSSF